MTQAESFILGVGAKLFTIAGPVIVYGVGYAWGLRIRSLVHTNIALGKQKQKRKQARERKARQTMVHRGPDRLN